MPGQNLTRLEAAERSATVRTQSYDVVLDLTRGETVFGSTTTARFTATPGSSTFIDLVAPTVRSVTLNGAPLDPAEVYADSRIALKDLAADNELVVVADCAYMHTGEGLHRFTDPADRQNNLRVLWSLSLQPVRGPRLPAGVRRLRAARPQGLLHLHRHRTVELDGAVQLPHP